MPGRKPRSAVHQRLADELAELDSRLGGLPSPEEADSIWNRIWYQEVHNSTALEGNTLVQKQVEVLLDQNIALGGKDLREYLEVRGYAKAAQWTYTQARRADSQQPLITLQEVRNLHHEQMKLVWDTTPPKDAVAEEAPGNWRRHEIAAFASGMKPPTHPLVPSLMDSWVKKVNDLRSQSPTPLGERIAALHAEFERIHPFLDGNGRAGRLLMNLTLIRLGYPPAIIEKKKRAAYLRGLAAADRGEPGALGELMARAVLANLTRFIMPAIAGEVRLLPLEALVRKDLTLSALRNAAQRGRLRAVLAPNGVWRSSKRWVSEYAASRYAPLRRPRTSAAAR
jgi:hypothetical protein